MRVLLNTKPLVLHDKTGVGYYVLNIYRELRLSGIEVIPTLNDGSRALINSLSKVSSRLRSAFGKTYLPFAIKTGDAIIGHLRRKGKGAMSYDIYHETSLDAMPVVNSASVCNIYDLAVMSFGHCFSRDFAGYARANITANAQAAERIIVNTEFIKSEAISCLRAPEDKIDVIPLAASGNYYRMDKPSQGLELIRRFTAKDYVLYVGTVEPRKNLKTLIRAFAEIRGKYDLSLIIAGGKGWMYDDVLRLPEELGIKDDVVFTGYINEKTMLHLYNFASVFVYPSVYEGFGIPVVEAMSCGAPVVISDIPSLKEVAGDAAVSFNPADHEELAHKMEEVIMSESLSKELRRKSLQMAKEFSWERTACLTIKSYEKTLGI